MGIYGTENRENKGREVDKVKTGKAGVVRREEVQIIRGNEERKTEKRRTEGWESRKNKGKLETGK